MAEIKNLLVVICETAGKQAAVRPVVEAALKKTKLSFTIKRVKTPPEITEYVKKHAAKYQVVAVSGGDGSIIAAMKALLSSPTKLLILPGGTANIIALDLGLPNDIAEVLKMYIEGRYKVTNYDVAQVNDQSLVLDVHSGWWSEAVRLAPRELKKRFGVLAYGITAIRRLPKAEKHPYEFVLRGKRIKVKAHALLIANQGFQNFLNVSLFPHPHRPGMVQVALIKSLSPLRLLGWFLGKSLIGRSFGGAIKTYRVHNMELIKSPAKVIYDDVSDTLKLPLKITGGQYEVKVLAPPREVEISRWQRIITKFRLNWLRQMERFRNSVLATPKFEYTRLAPHLYLGGRYRRAAYRTFKSWGVTGIVNMRRSKSLPAPEGFELLQLATTDWQAPPLDLLKKGVDFMEAHVKQGGAVYVHCRQGEGRGPTMAAAYLISQGLTVEEALNHIKLSRPMAHPNRSQVKRLAEWQEYCSKH